jgi:hypothetical protein
MKIVKCSASAIKTYYHCSFKYLMEKILKMESLSGKSALQGDIVHQVFEWMCKLKKRKKTYIDPEWLLDQSWDMHIKLNPNIEIRKITSRGEAADFKKCKKSIQTILNSDYNPYRLKIIDIERWFEIEMPGKEWECIDENNKKHQFTSRGYIDLVHEIDQNTIEIIDWKTGKRADFYTMKSHSFETLMHDIQVRLYHLAATELYPQYRDILVTIYYTSDGGPVTIPLSNNDIIPTISSLMDFFETAKKDTLFIRNRTWKCRMCSFERSGICQRVWSDLHAVGYPYIKDKYTKMSFINQKKIGKNK